MAVTPPDPFGSAPFVASPAPPSHLDEIFFQQLLEQSRPLDVEAPSFDLSSYRLDRDQLRSAGRLVWT